MPPFLRPRKRNPSPGNTVVPLHTVFLQVLGGRAANSGTPGGQVRVAAFIVTRGAAPGASPVCLCRRSSCSRSWLIPTAAAQTEALQSQALYPNKNKSTPPRCFVGAAHQGAPCWNRTLVLGGSPANSALLICPTKGSGRWSPAP